MRFGVFCIVLGLYLLMSHDVTGPPFGLFVGYFALALGATCCSVAGVRVARTVEASRILPRDRFAAMNTRPPLKESA